MEKLINHDKDRKITHQLLSRDQETAQNTKLTLTFCVYLCKVSAKAGDTDTTLQPSSKAHFPIVLAQTVSLKRSSLQLLFGY